MEEENTITENDEHLDDLTSCRSKYGLEYDIGISVFHAAREKGRYRNKFLCIDINNFQKFLDYNGYGESDQVLIRIAENLRTIYPKSKIYRFGGDEFVVEGADEWNSKVGDGVEVDLKYATVAVDTEVQIGHHHRAASWVMLHVHAGIVRSEKQGVHLKCEDRDEEK